MPPIQQQDDIDVIAQQWQQTGLETDFNVLQIVARLLRLSKAIEIKLAKLHADFGLKQGEFDVLATLKRCGDEALTPSQLYLSMLLSSGAMTSRLDRLESKQLIQRQHCQQDRRSIKVKLTSKGLNKINDVYPAHFSLLQQLLADVSEKDKKQLTGLLRSSLLCVEKTSL
jgi:DNA-binding MarR family transcriptional regulator